MTRLLRSLWKFYRKKRYKQLFAKCIWVKNEDVELYIGSDSNITQNSNICSEAALGISESVQHPPKASAQSCPVVKCQLPGLEYVVFVRGSGPHTIEYDYKEDRPLKEVIVSRKCAEAVLRGAQVRALLEVVNSNCICNITSFAKLLYFCTLDFVHTRCVCDSVIYKFKRKC